MQGADATQHTKRNIIADTKIGVNIQYIHIVRNLVIQAITLGNLSYNIVCRCMTINLIS